jgi:hypothetical protein
MNAGVSAGNTPIQLSSQSPSSRTNSLTDEQSGWSKRVEASSRVRNCQIAGRWGCHWKRGETGERNRLLFLYFSGLIIWFVKTKYKLLQQLKPLQKNCKRSGGRRLKRVKIATDDPCNGVAQSASVSTNLAGRDAKFVSMRNYTLLL